MPNILDKLIAFVSPSAAWRRQQYQKAIEVMAPQSRAYNAAGKGRRTANWQAASTSANNEINAALTFLRNRSRELVRNNGYAKKAVTEIANNLVGTGIKPTPITDSKPQQKKLKLLWDAWANTTQCDYDGELNYYGIQHLAALTLAESGEVLIRKHINVTDKSLPLPLQLQILEPDFIDTSKYQDRLENGGYIYHGIEYDDKNRKVAYWLWDHHPGDQMQVNITSKRTPKDEIIHLFKKERPGQTRGIPFGHAAMLRLKDLDEFEDTQLIRQKIAACFTVFRRKTNVPLIPGAEDSSNTLRIDKVEPGIIEDLAQGEEISIASPPDAGPNYDLYTKSILRHISCAYGIDYVTLTGDLTAVNFSSGRMGWLQFHRNITTLQEITFIPTLCATTWQWFIQMANIAGQIKTNLVTASWTAPRREMIDPAKEIEGMKSLVRAGFNSWQEVVRENGYNPEEVLTQMREDKENFDSANLQPECDPRFDAKKLQQNPMDNTNNQ